MGLTNLPTVGTTGDLGPVKRDRALQTPDPTRDVAASQWNALAKAVEEVSAAVGLADGSTAGSLEAYKRPETLLLSDPTYEVSSEDHNRTIAITSTCTVTLPASGVDTGTRAYIACFGGAGVTVTTSGSLVGVVSFLVTNQMMAVEHIGGGVWLGTLIAGPSTASTYVTSNNVRVENLNGVIRATGALALTIPELPITGSFGGETVLLDATGGAITISTSGSAVYFGDTVVDAGDSAVIYHSGGDIWRRLPTPYLPLTGGTLTGALSASGNLLSTSGRVESQIGDLRSVAGPATDAALYLRDDTPTTQGTVYWDRGTGEIRVEKSGGARIGIDATTATVTGDLDVTGDLEVDGGNIYLDAPGPTSDVAFKLRDDLGGDEAQIWWDESTDKFQIDWYDVDQSSRPTRLSLDETGAVFVTNTAERFRVTTTGAEVEGTLDVTGDLTAANIESGTWTPTATIVSNLDSVTPSQGWYQLVGNTVVGGLRVDFDPTSSGSVQFLLSTPVASNFTIAGHASGSAASNATQHGRVTADVPTDDLLVLVDNSGTGSTATWILFSYRVL